MMPAGCFFWPFSTTMGSGIGATEWIHFIVGKTACRTSASTTPNRLQTHWQMKVNWIHE